MTLAQPRRRRAVLVAPGSEESFEEGFHAFVERHEHELPRDKTDFIVLDMFANYVTGRNDVKSSIAIAERQARRLYR